MLIDKIIEESRKRKQVSPKRKRSLELFRMGMDRHEIAKALGISYSSVVAYCARMPSSHETERQKAVRERHDKIVHMAKGGIPDAKIAEKLELSVFTVSNVRRGRGVHLESSRKHDYVEARDREIIAAAKSGLSKGEIARRYNVSRYLVARVLLHRGFNKDRPLTALGERVVAASKKYSTVREIARAAGAPEQHVVDIAEFLDMDISDLPYWDAPKNLVHVPGREPWHVGFELSRDAAERLHEVRKNIVKRQLDGTYVETYQKKRVNICEA